MLLSIASQRSLLCFSAAYSLMFASMQFARMLSAPMTAGFTAVVFVSLLLCVIYGVIGRRDGWFGLVWIIPAGASLFLVGLTLMYDVMRLIPKNV